MELKKLRKEDFRHLTAFFLNEIIKDSNSAATAFHWILDLVAYW
jgi:hypothetical protein